MKGKNNAIIMTSIICGVILIVSLVALITLRGVTSGENTVNVQGIATVKAMPDLITVYFNVETKAETSIEAKNDNSEILNRLIDALIAQDFERKDIVTENFNIYQDYEWTDEGRKDKGFKATHSVKVELSIDEEDKIGPVIDAGVNAGALISYINFELTQESQNKYKAEAMKLAAEDARIKAESVALGFGKNVGKLVNVQVNDFGYSPWNVYSAKGMGIAEDAVMAQEAASNIQVGDKEISATISATFKLR